MRKSKYLFMGLIVISYLMIILGIYFWLSNNNIYSLKNQLINITFYFLEFNFLLIIIGIILNLDTFKLLYEKIDKKSGIALVSLILLGIVLTSFVAPQTHRLYYDEDIYMNVGQNLAYLHKAEMCNEGSNEYGVYQCYRGEYNKEPYGYPYFLSILYRLFGVSEELSFIFNNLIFGLTIFVVFLLGLLIFDNQHTGLWSAFIYVLVPQNILWFNTTAAEPSSTFWTAFAIFSVFLFMKYQKNSLLFLVACVLSFSLNFRPESILLLLIVLTAIFLFQQKLFMEYRFYVFGILVICLLIPLIGHHYAVRMENWGSFGDKFSFSYFKNNFIANASFYFKNIRFPVIYSLLALFGLLSKTKCKEISILVLWFLLFWGIFLFFYAGSYNYGVDVRFSLLSYVPFVLLSGYGLYRIQILLNKWTKNIYISFILVAVLALSFLPFMSMLRAETQEAWAARKDHKYAKEFAELLPENSIILTHNPNMFLVWGKNAAQTSIANNETTYVNNVLFQRYSGGMFFHWNYWCNVPDSLQNSFCEQILQSYDCKLIKEKTEKQYRYAIYQLKRAK